MTNVSTIRPGLLVSLKSGMRGNVSWERVDIEQEHDTPEGTREARWETQRVIADPAEHEAATKARGKALTLIRRACAKSAFGLLCPENSAENLYKAIDQARKIVKDFNDKASLTVISVNALVGRIASDDVEAAQAIASEIRDLISDMEDGVKKLDVKAIREAATKAKSVGQMLAPTMQAKVQIAIDEARAAARKIVKAGEENAQEVDRVALRRLKEARTMFLDIEDEVGEIKSVGGASRALDLEAEPPKPKVARFKMNPQRQLEL